jgi:YVTN family beta-propeller protein
MKKMTSLVSIAFALSVVLFSACRKEGKPFKNPEEMVVVANRGGGSISFIDAKTNTVTNTLAIAGSEPMYVVYVPSRDKLYVGDRAKNKLHVINPQTKTVEHSIDGGKGIFHMWADGQGKQLWVSNDIDLSVSVIDLSTNAVVKTINTGLKPHDVFLTADGSKAFVSILSGDAATPDKIYMYSTRNFAKTGETSVGKDPHLFHLPAANKLYVPCQSGQLYTLNGNNLSLISNNPFAGAHGIFPSPDQRNIFVTNISGAQLYSISAVNSTLNEPALNTINPTPHNIVVNLDGNKMFVTHSGATANTVSTYSIMNGKIATGTTITIGTNPFGLAYYKREKSLQSVKY